MCGMLGSAARSTESTRRGMTPDRSSDVSEGATSSRVGACSRRSDRLVSAGQLTCGRRGARKR